MTPELYEKDKFFVLPVAEWYPFGITPLESKDQPTGFYDDDGNLWVAVVTDHGLKRQRR